MSGRNAAKRKVTEPHEFLRQSGQIPGVGGIEVIPIPNLKSRSWCQTAGLISLVPVWSIYLIVTAIIWNLSPVMALLSIALTGIYLVTALGYFRHELWHNYFPGVSNPFFFNLLSYLLFSDAKVYALAHVTHHRDLHTVKDIEFCCEDYEKNQRRRKWQFVLEFLFGNIAWEAATVFRLVRRGEISFFHEVWTLALRFAILAGFCFGAEAISPGAGKTLGWVWLLTVWLGALITRHDQWMEHLGIVTEAPLKERVRMTRNLPNIHWANRLWNFFNHNDPRAHYFHHAYPQFNFRVVDGLQLPKGVPVITVPEYLAYLWNHFKTI